MSNVYTRNRKKTPFDVLANAEKLQDLVTLYVMNERYVPKKVALYDRSGSYQEN